MNQINCQICVEEFDRETAEHTTLRHLSDYLSDTIESYEREQYNHGGSDFSHELMEKITKLETRIKEIKN